MWKKFGNSRIFKKKNIFGRMSDLPPLEPSKEDYNVFTPSMDENSVVSDVLLWSERLWHFFFFFSDFDLNQNFCSTSRGTKKFQILKNGERRRISLER